MKVEPECSPALIPLDCESREKNKYITALFASDNGLQICDGKRKIAASNPTRICMNYHEQKNKTKQKNSRETVPVLVLQVILHKIVSKQVELEINDLIKDYYICEEYTCRISASGSPPRYLTSTSLSGV